MTTIALILAALAGALAAALVCKGIRLRLWLELLAGLGSVCGIWGAAMLSGSNPWPLAGFVGGYGGVVAYLRLKTWGVA